MRSCRGPGFADPLALPASRTSKAHAAETGFQPLPRGALEPSAQELASLVNEFYAAGGGGDLGSMGETDAGVVFQGDGDPLEAAAIVLETVRLVAQERNGLSFRLNTLGLCDQETIELLLASEELEREQQGDRRRQLAQPPNGRPSARLGLRSGMQGGRGWGAATLNCWAMMGVSASPHS